MKGINLRERGTEIKFLIEKELRILTIPCSVSDMVKRVGASRMPVMKHLESILSTPEFAGISIVRLGGIDVIYRVVAPPKPAKTEQEVEQHERHDSNAGADVSVGRSGEEG
jgi:hypothetical protein